MNTCPLCAAERAPVWIENDVAIAVPDPSPVVDGHTVVAPRRHVTTIYELTVAEQSAVWDLVAEVRQRLLAGLKPDAFKVGFQDSRPADQVLGHASVHVIPVREGNADPSREGIQWFTAEHAPFSNRQ